MAINKFITGKTSCYALWKYLRFKKGTKKIRTLATDTFNIGSYYKPWYKIFDFNRKIYGTYRSDSGGKDTKVNTFYHFILSPDPKDNITLPQLQDFTREWLEKCFYTTKLDGKCEAVAEYHNDNGILHAHIVINNINFKPDRGNKSQRAAGETNFLSSWLSVNQMRKILAYRKVMCEKRGWHDFFKEDEEELIEKCGLTRKKAQDIIKETKTKMKDTSFLYPDIKYKPPTQIIKGSSYFYTRKGSYYDKKEAKILEKYGTSQKEEIRKKIIIAKDLAKDKYDFLKILSYLHVGVQTDIYGKGWKFSHPNKPQLFYTGYRLGKDFTRDSIIKYLDNNKKEKCLVPYKDYKLKNGLNDTTKLAQEKKNKYGIILAVDNCYQGALYIKNTKKVSVKDQRDWYTKFTNYLNSKEMTNRFRAYDIMEKYGCETSEDLKGKINETEGEEKLLLKFALKQYDGIWENSEIVQKLGLSWFKDKQQNEGKLDINDMTKEEIDQYLKKVQEKNKLKNKTISKEKKKDKKNNYNQTSPSKQLPSKDDRSYKKSR